MDQSYEKEDCTNTDTKTEVLLPCSSIKADIESDASTSPKRDNVLSGSDVKINEEEKETPPKTDELNENNDLVQENIEAEKNEELSGDVPLEEKNEKWKLKIDIYSSTSSSGQEDSDIEEQKLSTSIANSEKLVDSLKVKENFEESEDHNKSESESEFLGFENEPYPSAVTAIYQKLIAKSEAAVDIDKWSSCSDSVTSPYSDYNSDEGDQYMQSPPCMEKYDTFSEKDDDEIVSSSRNNNDSMEYEESSSASLVTGDPFKISSSSKKRKDWFSVSSNRGKRHSADISNPAFKVPFTLGWKREVVYRSTVDGGANVKRLTDIYYYNPNGKKMRSSREILEYLEETRSPLTIENFTFMKDCIHPEDPNAEIIREAKKIILRKDDGMRNRKSRSKSSTPTMGSPHPEWSSDSYSSGKEKSTPRHGGSYQAKSGSKRKLYINQGMATDVGMYSPPWSNLAPNGSPKYESESVLWSGPSRKGGATIMPCSLRCPGLHGVVPTLQCHICVCLYHPECVGGIPMNQEMAAYICKNCERESKENRAEGSAPSGKNTSPPPLVPIDKLGKASPTHTYQSAAPPRLQRFPPHSNESHHSSSQVTGGANVFARPSVFVKGLVSNSGTCKPQVGLQFSDSVTRETSLGQSLAVMQGRKYVIVPKNILSVLPGAANAAAAAAAAFSGGTLTRGSVIPISRELLLSHPATKAVKVTGGTFVPPPLVQPTSSQQLISSDCTNVSGEFIQRAREMKPQYVIVSSPVQPNVPGNNREMGTSLHSTKVTSSTKSNKTSGKEGPRNTKEEIEASRKRKLAAFAMEPATKRSKLSQSNGIKPDGMKNGLSLEEAVDQTNSLITVNKQSETSAGRRDLFSQHFMSNLSMGYSALLHVFHYLNIQDLLRAAMVCRMWRDLAGGHHSLWRTVRMKNSQVVDWVGFADTLARNRTEILDLRKMLLPTSGPSMSSTNSVGNSDENGASKTKERRIQWGQEFCRSIGRASGSLRRLELCRCGTEVLEGVASECPFLTALCAQAIRSHDINLDFVGKLCYLQELRLKSPSGMNLCGDLSVLTNLTSLKHLSLTTVRDLVGDEGERLSALSSLVNLETLELGECAAFGEAACEAFENLKKLVRLRLESGQIGERLGNMTAKSDLDMQPKGLLVALAKLPSLAQLELVNFDIGPGFDQGLAQCTSLHRLLIIPSYVAQSATSNRLVMSAAMKLAASLHSFTWGVTHEVLQAIELFVASDHVNSNTTENSLSGEDQEDRGNHKGKPSSECLPILKPMPSVIISDTVKEEVKDEVDEEGDKFSRVEFVPLSKLHGLLSAAMPNTKVQIVKMPFSATWRQGISEVDL